MLSNLNSQKDALNSNSFINNVKQLAASYPAFVLAIFIFFVLSVTVPAFFTTRNLINLLNQSAVLGIASIGLSFVVFSEGIDLSIGANISFSAVIGAMIMRSNPSTSGVVLGIIAMIATGTLIGTLNGVVISKVGITAIMMTLSSMIFIEGFAIYITNARTISNLPPEFRVISHISFLGLPFNVWTLIIFLVIGHYITKFTAYGRMIYATGENQAAAEIVGINSSKIRILTFTISGFCAGISSFLMVSRLGVANPAMGGFLLLDIVSAVVLGGASIFGGRGNMIGTISGVLLIALISNSMNLLGIPHYTAMIIKGTILLLAVSIDAYRMNLISL